MKYDKIFLNRAFELAKYGRFTTSPNPNVGCVIVYNNQIVGEGFHKKTGELHAEIYALNMAKNKAKGSTVYVTLEPCSHQGNTPPCTDALIQAGVYRVVSSISDPNPKISGNGFYKLKKAGIKIKKGLMKLEAESINLGFFKRMRTGIPWIRSKIASSIDGCTAMISGESKWITSIQSRQDVQRWRAESDAILSTATTILSDNPSLTVRWSSLPKNVQIIYQKKNLQQPTRIIIDSTNRITPDHRIIKEKGKTWLIRHFSDNLFWPSSVEQIIIPKRNKKNRIDLIELMIQLGNRNINNLLVESGANLTGALLNIELIDEIILYQATKLLGSHTRPICILPKLNKLNEAKKFTLIDIKRTGPDIYLRLRPIKN